MGRRTSKEDVSVRADPDIERILSYSFISPKGGCHKIERKKKKDICALEDACVQPASGRELPGAR